MLHREYCILEDFKLQFQAPVSPSPSYSTYHNYTSILVEGDPRLLNVFTKLLSRSNI